MGVWGLGFGVWGLSFRALQTPAMPDKSHGRVEKELRCGDDKDPALGLKCPVDGDVRDPQIPNPKAANPVNGGGVRDVEVYVEKNIVGHMALGSRV